SSVTDDEGVQNMVKQTMDKFGRIDILINNAGILRDKSFSKMEIADFQLVVDVHLMGTVKPTKAVWEIMKEQNYGRIVVTASSTGLYGNFGQTNYGAAKLAVVGFINTLKLEGQKNNIHCNALAPVAYTRMTSDLMPPEAEEMLTPDAVSPGVMFLVSEDAPTGMILCAGAGVFAAARMEEAEGIFLGREGLTAEKVAENWGKISDFSNATPFFMGGEQTGKFFKLATGGK
ncbi:MAG: SDR family NAD(P)-dependent oxidoreductase, partial [Parvibaculum sp.]|nr:SDR family NAD(P)-dependent oxidoreductase [Parvibaculum sp.]